MRDMLELLRGMGTRIESLRLEAVSMDLLWDPTPGCAPRMPGLLIDRNGNYRLKSPLLALIKQVTHEVVETSLGNDSVQSRVDAAMAMVSRQVEAMKYARQTKDLK